MDSEMEAMLRSFGAVCVEGPKACGKTWMSMRHANSAFFVSDPKNNFNNKAVAAMNPEFSLRGEAPHLVDEWQEVPEIWDAVRFQMDCDQAVGRFILTGSSTPQFKGVLHSGTGRIGKLRMRPMSLFESGDSTGEVTLSSMFDGTMGTVEVEGPDLEGLIGMTVRGGWPMVQGRGIQEAIRFNRGYLKSILDDDLPRLDRVDRNRGKMEALIRSLARNESTMASNSKLMDDMKEFDNETVSENTLGIYMDVLDRMFLLDPQMAFDPNVRSSIRVGKKPKRHLADPSLAIAAMGLTPRMLLEDLNTYGFMFESMCVRDLRVYAQASGGEVYHYRDDSGMEVDAIVEMPDGQWGAFEIKLGQNQVDAAAEGLLAFRDKMAARTARGAPSVLCVIVGMASYAYRRTDGVFVVPITALGCRDSMMDVEASE